jgi:hypothetical protein
VVGAVSPDPAALTAHDHGLVLAEAGDVCRDDRAARPFECSLLRCLDPLGQDQRVVGDVGELAEHLRLVDRAGDAPAELALLNPLRRDEQRQQIFGDLLSRVRRSVEGADGFDVYVLV